ncbi:methyltransferase [Trypanosoma rangeli]|uniref:Cap-specific mRNA (nucleoside-2'-O-)-methyltransferase 1 n=1 Tax=Trypanosoma rangeli TaxID=5698 RepID=A0A3S5IS12_TRYRA|nr:methyltransferase [Trypanosoma rangeli]RNF09573.1 methyltransferase [Trypanosoma rangeli]|eukprot:RNF09573.1 methyltransferase [Trypanosoma rangeli]
MLEVADKTVEFLLRHDAARPPPGIGLLTVNEFERVHWRDAFDSFQEAGRLALWKTKSALDDVNESAYLAARDALFPLAVSGSQGVVLFGNRAGHKLREAMEATGVWEHLQHETVGRKGSLAFADVCGGPGAFSQALFGMCRQHKLKLRGFGMTLRSVKGLDWYSSLLSDRFLATYGIDGTGDVFNLANIEALRSLTLTENMKLVVADGGFNVPFDIANYQETISGRILFGQWLTALKLLRVNGCFLLKLFDTFSPLLRVMLYLSTYLYDRVHVVKPRHSRVLNSERYLVCLGFRGAPEPWMKHFERCYQAGFTDNDHIPTIMPISWVMEDETFLSDMTEMSSTIASNQVVALKMVLAKLQLSISAKQTEEQPAS